MISLVKKIILSILIWLLESILLIALYLAMLLCAILFYPFDKKRAFTHRQCFWWSDAAIAINPYWKLEITGLNNIDKKRTYIIIANHQSMADIVVAYKLKMQFKWVTGAGQTHKARERQFR